MIKETYSGIKMNCVQIAAMEITEWPSASNLTEGDVSSSTKLGGF